jgi:hypothetical protein
VCRYARTLLDRELSVLLLSEAMLLGDADDASRELGSADDAGRKVS